MRLLLAWLVATLVAPLLLGSGYLKIGDIEGESDGGGFQGWIELSSVESLIETVESADTRSRLSRHEPLALEKSVDKASPLLAQALASGEVFGDATIVATRGGGAGQRYFEMKLGSARVVDWRLEGEFESGELSESFSLYYGNVDWLYRRFAEGAQALEEVQVNWDLEAGEGGSVSAHAPTLQPVAEVLAEQGEVFEVSLGISDVDTEIGSVSLEVESRSSDLVKVLGVEGAGESRTLTLQASELRSGLAAIELRLDDGDFQVVRAFSVMVGVETPPFEAYLAAYFSEEELADRALVGAVGDPDGDELPTVLEFYLWTHPNEFSSQEEATGYVAKFEDGAFEAELRFWRRVDAGLSGGVAFSESLKQWSRLEAGAVGNPSYEESVDSAGGEGVYEEVLGIVRASGLSGGYVRIELDAVF